MAVLLRICKLWGKLALPSVRCSPKTSGCMLEKIITGVPTLMADNGYQQLLMLGQSRRKFVLLVRRAIEKRSAKFCMQLHPTQV
jgi:hypothetical protein